MTNADEGAPLRLSVLRGADQTGVSRLPLRRSLLVEVLNADGSPVPDVPVLAEVIQGEGEVSPARQTSRTSGALEIPWILGAPGPQRLQLALDPDALRAGSPPEVLEVRATALPLDQTDVVIVEGSRGPLMGSVVTRPGEEGFGVDILQARRHTDSVVHLYPESHGVRDVVVFGFDNRPGSTSTEFTPGPDTVRIVLEPPVVVPIRIENYLDEGAQAGGLAVPRTLEQIERMSEVWIKEGMGLRVGDVAVVERWEEGLEIRPHVDELCEAPAADAIVVSLVSGFRGASPWGFGCSNGRTWLAPPFWQAPLLTAHEIGHTFTLGHTTTGVMVSSGPGTDFTAGEIFQAHFHENSALNTILDAQPEDRRLSCFLSRPESPCISPSFNLPTGW